MSHNTIVVVPEVFDVSFASTSDTISEEHANIWGTWHTTLKPILKDQQFTGKHFLQFSYSL